LVVGDHGGALMQTAFWLDPRHAEIPPGCDPARGDLWYTNPTQGGYYADVIAGTQLGNPIGIFGTDTNPAAFDQNEFIRFEDQGKTVHYKSRFIRHDYCLKPQAEMVNQSLWDTDFYIEGKVSFDDHYPDTIKLISKISYEGIVSQIMTGRQMPIIFARYIPRIGYILNNQFVTRLDQAPAKPDKSYASLLGISLDSGIGMVISPRTFSNDNPNTFGYNGLQGPDPYEPVSVISPTTGAPDLNSFGVVSGVNLVNGSNWQFEPGGTFQWTVYFPVGSFSSIKQNAENILQYENFGQMPDFSILILKLGQDVPAKTFEDLDGSLQVNSLDFSILMSNFGKIY
jgi:hypothetical protein